MNFSSFYLQSFLYNLPVLSTTETVCNPLIYAKYTSILGNMPRKSIAIISSQELKSWKNQLVDTLSSLGKENLVGFLEEFLTEEELVMLSKRLQLYSLLYQNMPPKDVQQMLGVSREIIRFYDYRKDEKSASFKSAVLKVKSASKKNPEETSKLANFMDLAMKSRSNSKARAKLYQGDLD